MKTKWLIGIVVVLFVVASIRFPVANTVKEKIVYGNESVNLSTGKVTAGLSGKVYVRDIVAVLKEDTLCIDSLTISSSLVKLFQLKKKLPTYLSELDSFDLYDLQSELSKKYEWIKAKGVAFRTATFSCGQGTLKLKSKGKGCKGKFSYPSTLLWGKKQNGGVISFRISPKGGSGKISQKVAGSRISGSIAHERKENVIHYKCEGNRLALHSLLPDSLSGELSFSINGQMDSTLAGVGSVKICSFKDNESGALRRLRSTLSYVGVDSVVFDKVNADFTLSEGVLESVNVQADGDEFSATASGSLFFPDMKYRFRVSGFLPETHEKKVSSVVWGGLLPDSTTGGKKFNGTLEGRRKHYSVSVDQRIIKRSVKTFFREIFN